MLDVVSDNRQTESAGSCTYDDIEVAYGQAFGDKGMTNLCIVIVPVVGKRKDRKICLNNLRLFHVLFNILTMDCAVCKFRYRNFGSKNLVFRNL